MRTVLLSGSPILDVDLTLLIYIGLFFVLFFILRAFVFRPIMALFDARERSIDGAKREARQLEKDAEAKLERFEEQMAKMRREAGAERDQMRVEASKRERALLEEVKAETEAMVADAEAKMAEEAARVRGEIAAQTPALARQIASKLLGREVTQ